MAGQLESREFADFVAGSQARMVRLGELLTGDRGRAEDLISIQPVGDAPGGPVIAWVECQRRPVPSFPIVTPRTPGRSS